MAEKVDCVITYPQPQTEADDTNEDGFSLLDLPGEKPVVVLLGWAGSLDKHLAKYSSIYEQIRCITVRYTAPSSALYFKQGQLVKYATGVLETIYEKNLDKHPIIFHIFSNGGCYLYCNISKLIQNTQRYQTLDVQGCVIDSAPGKRRIFKAAKAFMAMLKVNVVIRYLVGFCVLVYLAVSYLICSLFDSKSSSNAFLLYDGIRNDPGKWPQMFLFSKADDIISYEDVEEVIENRKQLGVSVDTHCWEDSGHVSHFLRHKEVYSNLCHQFIKKCSKL